MKMYKKRVSIGGKKITIDFPVGYERVKKGLVLRGDLVFIPDNYVKMDRGWFQNVPNRAINDSSVNDYFCIIRKISNKRDSDHGNSIDWDSCCKDCGFYHHDEKLNPDEGHCFDPDKAITRILYWRNNELSIEYPTVKAYNCYCSAFNRKK
jgi:hypothetical protein